MVTIDAARETMTPRLAVVLLLEACGIVFFVAQLAMHDVAPLGEAPSSARGEIALPATPAAVALPGTVDASHSVVTVDATPERIAATTKWNPTDPVGIVLSGTVRWRDGTLVDDASIHTRKGDTGRTAVSRGGDFSVLGLEPGEWLTSVGARDGVRLVETITITDDAWQWRDFALDRSFPVRVVTTTSDGTDLLSRAGKPTLILHVAGQRDPFPERFAPTETGFVQPGDATFETAERMRATGTLRFASPPPAYAALLMGCIVLQQQRVEPGQKEVKFVVDPARVKANFATVTARVVDADSGRPIARAGSRLSPMPDAGPPNPPAGLDGRIVADCQPGLLFLSVTSPKHENYRATIRASAGEQIDLGDIRLGPALSFRGRVVDERGEPGSATITWIELKWHKTALPFSSHRMTRTEADGSFLLTAGRGPIAIRVNGADGSIAAGVFDNPPDRPIELRLVTTAKCLLVRDADPTRAFTVTFFDDRRRPVAAVSPRIDVYPTPVALPPGSYAFEVHDESDRLVRSGDIALGATPVTLDLR